MDFDGTLYDRLGGREAIESVVDDFYDRVLADEQLRPFFDGVDMERQRAHQATFIESVTGGPADYSGGDMATAHAHLDISREDFDAVAEHLQAALEAAGVDDEDVESVLEAVAELEPAVVSGD